MNIAIAITDARQIAGVTKALAAYNNRPGQSEDNMPLTADEFIGVTLAPQLSQWADQHAPAIITADALRKRFTSDERRNIRAAAVAHPETIGTLYDRLDSIEEVHLDPETDGGQELRAGLAALTGAGLLGEGRAAEIAEY